VLQERHREEERRGQKKIIEKKKEGELYRGLAPRWRGV
jgi:hypothetical protein